MDVSKILSRSAQEGVAVPTRLTKPTAVPAIVEPEVEPEPETEEEKDEWVMTEEYINPEDVQKMKELLSLEAADDETIILRDSDWRHPLSERFHELLKEVGKIHDKKQNDYGTPNDPYANVRGATEFGLPAPMGSFIAMSDIMSRIKSFCVNGRLENEPLENALKDMAVYSLIALVLYEEEERGKN